MNEVNVNNSTLVSILGNKTNLRKLKSIDLGHMLAEKYPEIMTFEYMILLGEKFFSLGDKEFSYQEIKDQQ